MKHLDIKITGQVQGVFLRQAVKERAKKLGLIGFVKNEPDGSVYIEAEGEENNLKVFLKWLHGGSDFSKVEKVETQEGQIKNFDDFKIVF